MMTELEKSWEQERILRRLLWLRHGCSDDTSSLYGDDGEMQCCKCLVDFKRTPAQEIENTFFMRGLATLSKSVEETQRELDLKDARQIFRLDPPEKK